MNRDLEAIAEEIDVILSKPPSMDKYSRLATLFICKEHIENMLKTDNSTVVSVLDSKMEQIGARATILKLEPILAEHIKTLEMVAPTISGEFLKRIKEM